MPRFKIPKRSTLVDMTAMTDMVFLLLNFFIMTTTFKPDEPVAIVTPTSINTQLLPDSDVILVSIDKKGRVFFNMDGQPKRQQLIGDIDQQFKLNLSEKEKNQFISGAAVGVDMQHLKAYLGLNSDGRRKFTAENGIPVDSINNELGIWLQYGQNAQGASVKKLKYCIKADNETPYPYIKQVLETFKKKNIQHVNLVTDLESVPV